MDLLNKKTKYDRFLEILPGFFTWAVMLSPVWLGLIYPPAIVYLLTFLAIYWSYLAIRQTIGMYLGYKYYQQELATDWVKKIKELNFAELPEQNTLPENLEKTKHFLLVPCVNEPVSVLKPAFESFLNQTYDTKKITLIYTIEEKYKEETVKTLKSIHSGHENKFEEIMYFIHPAGIPGEAIGAGAANRTWGAKKAVEKMKNDGKNVRNYIFTTADSDHVLYPQFLARLTHLYLTTDRRDNHFYATALHLFDNNHWKVPTMMRIESDLVTLGTLAARAFTWGLSGLTKDTFAGYSASLQTLIDADYWDVSMGVDDTVFFWRAFFARNGDFHGATHYIPYSADAVQGETFYKAHVSLYKQLLRWGWGVIVIPYSLKGMIGNKKIPLRTKLLWIYFHFKHKVLLINIVFLITFGFGLLTLVNQDIKQTIFAYSLPNIMSLILTFTLVFIIPSLYYRAKIVKPMPKEWPWWKKLLMFSEGFLVIINLLTFSFIPFIEANTRMMFGKKMKDLYHTPKVR